MRRLLRWIIEAPNTGNICHWIGAKFPIECFDGLDRLFYLFIKWCGDVNIAPSITALEKYMSIDGLDSIRSNDIRIDTMENFDYNNNTQLREAVAIITSTAIEQYKMILSNNEEENTEFRIELVSWLKVKKKELLQDILRHALVDLVDDVIVEDEIDSLSPRLNELNRIFDRNIVRELDFIRNDNIDNNENNMIFLAKTLLPCIDIGLGGLHQGDIYNITGLSGIGKSRFAAKHFAYIPAVNYGIGVRYDSMELATFKMKNMFTAIHISNTMSNINMKIPDSHMNRNELDEREKRIYNSCRSDLFDNPNSKYGRIDIRHEMVPVEEFEDMAMSYLRNHKDIRIWVYDYMGFIVSKPTSKYTRQLEIHERIRMLLECMRRISDTTGCMFVCLSQYTKDGAMAAKSGKIIQQGDIQGGQAIQQYADGNINLKQTDQQKVANLIELDIDKARSGKSSFGNLLRIDLSISNFIQQQV